jgi:enoyl-CoA hydratase
VANDLLLTGRVIAGEEALRVGLVSRIADDVVAEALAAADGMCRFSPYGLAMTKDVLWADLEISSMATAIELEDRNQLMLGFTENLPEAIRAFAAGRPPVYTDEPRRDMF